MEKENKIFDDFPGRNLKKYIYTYKTIVSNIYNNFQELTS